MNTLKWFIFVFVDVLLFSLLAPIYAFPLGSNGWYLDSPLQTNNSDLVCKIKVISISRGEPVSNSQLFMSGLKAYRMKATAKVLSVIKGKCPESIEIEFEYPIGNNIDTGIPISNLITGLSEKEICIVFLQKQKDQYKLNSIKSKLRVVPEVLKHNFGDEPNMRLVDEFLAGCESDDEFIKLQAAEELGFQSEEIIKNFRTSLSNTELFDKNALMLGKIQKELIRSCKSKDFVIRNISYISCFQADVSPGIEGPLQLLRTNPSVFDKNDSMKKYEIQNFSVSDLQVRLLETMDSATRRTVYDMNNRTIIRREDGIHEIYRGLREFDYAEFFNQALDCNSVKNSEQMRKAIANILWIRFERKSVPVIVRLLDDRDVYVRQTAVSALRKCINGDYSNSWEPDDFYRSFKGNEYYFSANQKTEESLEERQKDYQEHEQEYIKYWKDWWQNKKKDFSEQLIEGGTK